MENLIKRDSVLLHLNSLVKRVQLYFHIVGLASAILLLKIANQTVLQESVDLNPMILKTTIKWFHFQSNWKTVQVLARKIVELEFARTAALCHDWKEYVAEPLDNLYMI